MSYYYVTGRQSWGISWYINDKIIPEITLKRGETFKFRTEGGNNPHEPAKYHPFYITDDPVGGYSQKTQAEKNVGIIFTKRVNIIELLSAIDCD